MKFQLLCLPLLCLGFYHAHAQTKIKVFPLSDVRLLSGPFQKAQETDKKYMLSLEVNRLLAPFRREAGLPAEAEIYGNWESSGLDGHIGGHYLSALALMYASTGDETVKERLGEMLAGLDACQEAGKDGYIGGIPGGRKMWEEIRSGKINASAFSLNEKWVPLYNIHKLFAGLNDAFQIAGDPLSGKILVRLADWFHHLMQPLTDAQLQQLLKSEHGGMNEALVDVYQITKDEKYLTLAKRFSHRLLLDPLLNQRDELSGLHANTQIPKVIGFAKLASLSGDSTWLSAADFFWNTVTTNRTVSIGGNSVREHFHPSNNFTAMLESREGPETCNSYNMLKLTKELHLNRFSPAYLDYYERTLYNHILSSQHPDGGFVYFTPMRPGHYRVYSQADKGFWCCVGSGMENHGKYGEFIYTRNESALQVNLFIPSVLTWRDRGLVLTQKTDFPEEEKSLFRFKLTSPQKFRLQIRRPSWIEKQPMKFQLNGKSVEVASTGDGFLEIDRTWQDGDQLSVMLPMTLRVESLPDGSPWISILKGPIVLAEPITDTASLKGLKADDSRMGHVSNGLLFPIYKTPVVVTDAKPISHQLKPVKGQALTYTAPFYPSGRGGGDHLLVPFYSLHDSRYILYWRVANPVQMDSLIAEWQQKDEEAWLLERRTVDQVAPGEQQPEADHAFRDDRSSAGFRRERHFRSATGGFSYLMSNTSLKAAVLRITVDGKEKHPGFDVWVDDILLKTITLSGNSAEDLIDIDIDLPERMIPLPSRRIRFNSQNNNGVPAIFYVRLLSK